MPQRVGSQVASVVLCVFEEVSAFQGLPEHSECSSGVWRFQGVSRCALGTIQDHQQCPRGFP